MFQLGLQLLLRRGGVLKALGKYPMLWGEKTGETNAQHKTVEKECPAISDGQFF